MKWCFDWLRVFKMDLFQQTINLHLFVAFFNTHNPTHATSLGQLDAIYPGLKCLCVDSLTLIVGGTTCVIRPLLVYCHSHGEESSLRAWDRFLYLLTDPFPGSSIQLLLFWNFFLHQTLKISWRSALSKFNCMYIPSILSESEHENTDSLLIRLLVVKFFWETWQ